MFQKTSKTLYYMKIIVCEIPLEVGSGTLSGHLPVCNCETDYKMKGPVLLCN